MVIYFAILRAIALGAVVVGSVDVAQANWLSNFHWRQTPTIRFEQHFAPLENLEAIDVALINEAGYTIDLAAYVLTDVPVINALTDAAQRGVRIRIFRQFDPSDPSPRVAAALNALLAAGAQQRFKEPGSPLMHLKAYCVDGGAFRFGAANFSPSGLKRQDNDLDIRRGPDVCDAFELDFDRIWR
jgi:phosphatidylserine/phosphatidylglycerophosphate/cardiolipin synthase-like enzyme